MSRLVPEKNIHGVVQAYRDSSPPWPLVIAGGGADTAEYVEALQEQAHGCEGIRFVGPVAGRVKEALLRHAGGFVNASFLEGLSLGILEALGEGVPVAVSSIAANLDVFALAPSPPASLRTFAPDDRSGLGAALHALTRLNQDERRDWSLYARTVRDRFSWDGIAARTETVYRRAVRNRSA
jgi:glycosyltransferase involved in cell wall biosynthesis